MFKKSIKIAALSKSGKSGFMGSKSISRGIQYVKEHGVKNAVIEFDKCAFRQATLFFDSVGGAFSGVSYQLKKPLLDYIKYNAQAPILFLFYVLMFTFAVSLLTDVSDGWTPSIAPK